MKRIYLYTVSACLLLLSACNSDNSELPGVGNNSTPSAALRIEVSASDFTHAGDANTRATDSGNTTTFENGDRIGITVLDESKNILYNNIPYKYNKPDEKEGTWEFDKNNGEGKTALYYDKQATTYLAYFPYSSKADGAEDGEALKAKFPPLPDQRSKDAYRASDLLLWEGKLSDGSPSDGSQKTLNIAFTHAYSSLSFPSSVEVKQSINEQDFFYPASASDVSFTINEKLFFAYRASDGSCRIVVSPETSGTDETSVRCLFGVASKMFSGEMTVEEWNVNTLYTLMLPSTEKIDIGEYGLDKARQLDFYCRSGDGSSGYLIPKEAISLPEETTCFGIVFWAGDVTNDNYKLLNNGTHGLVVSLWDLECPQNENGETDTSIKQEMKWTYGTYESIQNWLDDKERCKWEGKPVGFNIQAENSKQGYVNTLALQAYNDYVVDNPGSKEGYGSNSGYRVKPIVALEKFKKEHPAPLNSSDWYWPSVYELRYVCSGIWQTGASKDGINLKDALNKQIEKVVGGNTESSFGYDYYWSSTEDSDYNNSAWYVYFGSGYVFSGRKKSNTYRVRPLLAF